MDETVQLIGDGGKRLGKFQREQEMAISPVAAYFAQQDAAKKKGGKRKAAEDEKEEKEEKPAKKAATGRGRGKK